MIIRNLSNEVVKQEIGGGEMFPKKSMSTKFIKSFFILIVIPIIIISIALNKFYKNVLLEHYSEKMQLTMEQISIGIENELDRISLTAATISHDKRINSLVTEWNREEDPLLKFELSKEIDSKLNYLFNYTKDINSILFFMRNKGNYYFKAPLSKNETTIRHQEWYKKAIKNNGIVLNLGTLQSLTGNSNNKRELSVAITPNIISNQNDVEVIYFQFRTAIFDWIYSRFKADQIGKMLILNNKGEIIVSPHKELVGKRADEIEGLDEISHEKNQVFTKDIDGKKEFISTYTTTKSNWIIVNIVDYNTLTHDMDKILRVFIVVFIIIILFFITFSMQFFKDIIKPIKELINKMKSVEKGDFHDEINVQGKSEEIKALGSSFNNMIYEVNNLMIERDLKEKERSKEEMRALQAQINPHFIYNTLNSIRLMAMIAKVESIKNMTDAFMKLLSSTFKHESNFIRIKDEIECLRNYAHIMKVRYGDNFELQIDVHEKIMSYYIIKLILQPIVENCILHGFNDLDGKGKITIKGYIQDENIIFEVTDNGIGMFQEQIEKLLTEEETHRRSFNQIGIKNVHKRIKLNHGDKYGLSIESESNKYTTIRLLLPIIRKIKGD